MNATAQPRLRLFRHLPLIVMFLSGTPFMVVGQNAEKPALEQPDPDAPFRFTTPEDLQSGDQTGDESIRLGGDTARPRQRGFTILRAPRHSTPPPVPATEIPSQSPPNRSGTFDPGTAASVPAATTSAVPPQTAADSDLAEKVSLIQQRIEQVQATEGLPEPLQAEAIKRFQQALEFLKLATEAERKRQTIQAELDQAPQRIAELKAQLDSKHSPPSPAVDAAATLSQLEQQQAQAVAQEEVARQALDKFQTTSKQRAERAAKLPRLIELLSQQKSELQASLGVVPEGEHPLITEARTAELEARALLLDVQGPLFQLESLSGEALAELNTLRGDLLQRQLKRAEKQATAWRQLVADFRKTEAERKAREARQNVANAHPALKELAQENAELAEQRVTLSETIGQATEQIQNLSNELERLETDYKEVTEKEKTVGLTRAVGLLLRQQREKLPQLTRLTEQLSLIESEIPRCQMEVLTLKNQRTDLTDLEAVQESILQNLNLDESQSSGVNVTEMVHDMLEAKRTYLTDLLNDYETYQHQLTDLDFNVRKLIAQTQEYEAYIDKYVLWIRSTDMMKGSDFSDAARALNALIYPQRWSEFASGIAGSVRQSPLEIALASVICLLIIIYRHRIGHHLRSMSERMSASGESDLRAILKALLLSVLSASLWPAMLGVAAWWLLSIDQSTAFSNAFAQGLRATATVYWTLNVARQICRPEGMGEVHFHWPSDATRVVYRNLSWTMLLGLPLVFLVVLIDSHKVPEWNDSLGRMLFIVGMILLATILARTLYQGQALLKHVINVRETSALHRLRYAWYLIGVGMPVAFAILAFLGYYYTVEQLAGRLVTTAWLAIVLQLSQALLSRWVDLLHNRLESRRLTVAQTCERSEQSAPMTQTIELTEAPESEASETQTVAAAANDYDLANITRQVHRLLHGVVSLSFVLGCWLIWSNVLPALGILDQVELWKNTVRVAETVETGDGTTSTQMVDRTEATTLGHLLIAAGILAATLFAGRNLPGLLEVLLLQRLPLDQGGRHAVTTICRYALTLVGVIFACRVIGIRWSSVQWLVAAMTVGLGFGLQEIFANFVSGLILLIERPLRIGDLVTVGSVTGTVSKMHIRATTVTDPDRRELVVPNKKFITDDFVNWTLSDPVTRVVLPVGIAYGSDTTLAHGLLMRVAQEHPFVLEEPAPSAIFAGFGDSTLDFQLRVFIPRRDCYTMVVHELNSAIDREFAAAKIEIAFPQRDLNIRSIDGLAHLLPSNGPLQRPPSSAAPESRNDQEQAA